MDLGTSPLCAREASPGMILRQAPLGGVTGVILAGGTSSRMGCNKALLPYRGSPLIEVVYRQLRGLFSEVVVVTNDTDLYAFLPCRKVRDIHPGEGVLAGLHAALVHTLTPSAFVTACDMPFLNPPLIRELASRADASGVVIPEGPDGVEPLHGVYGRGCQGAVEAALAAGERRIVSFFGSVRLTVVGREEVARLDPRFRSFRNVNTAADYARLAAGQGDAGRITRH